jgi:hypothetical protein
VYIGNRVREADLQARDIKTKATIRSCGQQVWDIDLGFVVDKVLLLVEAKNYQKNVKYHAADGGTVSGRIQSWESLCEQLDAKLQRYGEAVRRKWPNPAVAGAICIVCTEEAEFVASADRKYWLGLPEHPRVCTIRLRRGPQDVRRDIQVPLAPPVSRRLIPFAATVLRSLALLR